MKRLLETELVEDVEPSTKSAPADPRRRYYRITSAGRRALEHETRQLASVIDVARLKRVIR